MTALKVIGIILLILLLIALIRVGAEVRFGKETVVTLRIGPFRKKILPGAEKPPEEQKTKKQEQRAEKKPKKGGRPLPKPTVSEITDLISTALSALRSAARAVCRRLRIDPLALRVTFGGADPADIAQSYGYACAAMWALMPHAEELFNIPHPSLHLRMDYAAPKTSAEGAAGLSVRIGDMFAIAFALAVPLLKWYLRFKKAHTNDAPSAHRDAADDSVKAAGRSEEQTEKLTA